MTTVDENGHFFEGAEKLLEIWFDSSVGDKHCDLRTIDKCTWQKLLNHVSCQILNVIENEEMKAYLLSESSMFISKNKFILKTCGKTTLLYAVEALIELAKTHCGFDKVLDVFYSRRNYLRPDLQHSIHSSFDLEVAHLDSLFKNGAAYGLGRLNHDCWYLYTLDHVGVSQPDQTLELLMQDLDQEKMKQFTKEICSTAKEATVRSGIAQLIPDALIDDWLFDPCGYSMNALLPGGYYFTIHITPEEAFSYVSFETNIPMDSYHGLIIKVLKIFQPGKFLMTLFANSGSKAEKFHYELQDKQVMDGYCRTDHMYCLLKSYNLTYTMYERLREPPH